MTTASFPRHCRLLNSRQFRMVFDQNQRHADRYMVVLGRDTGQIEARLGITVSKKVSRRAVDRNQIKRHLRDSFRKYRHELPAMDFVVIARRDAVGAGSADLKQSLLDGLRRLTQQDSGT